MLKGLSRTFLYTFRLSWLSFLTVLMVDEDIFYSERERMAWLVFMRQNGIGLLRYQAKLVWISLKGALDIRLNIYWHARWLRRKIGSCGGGSPATCILRQHVANMDPTDRFRCVPHSTYVNNLAIRKDLPLYLLIHHTRKWRACGE